MRRAPSNVFKAGAVAWALSGAPSTLIAAIRRDDLLGPSIAAGTLLPGRRDRPGFAAGIAAHTVVTAVWTPLVAAATARSRHPALAGALAGAAIAALDLGVIGRRYPAIAALSQPPQWADHVAFGAIVGWLAARR
jgi:hypothetical protein